MDAVESAGERFNPRDIRLILACLAIVAVSVVIIVRYFSRAFPEASIEFRYDRPGSAVIAQRFLAQQRLSVTGLKHGSAFEDDDQAKIFLERSIGLEKANPMFGRDVQIWFWRHRWFRPLQEEEFRVDVSPTGRLVGFEHKLPEDRAMPAAQPAQARAIGETFLRSVGVDPSQSTLVSESERTLPKRIQRILTWESKRIRPAGAPYRYTIVLDGAHVGAFSQDLKVPDAWKRSYAELRSKNNLAGQIDSILIAATVLAALVIFVTRMRRGDMQLRLLGGIAIASVVLVTGVSLNSFPQALANYQTTESYPAFIAGHIFGALIQGIGIAMLLVVVVGAGEALYRERLPKHLAIGRVWNRHALRSKRVFLAFVIGYTLVAFFMAYQVVFYIVADHFGAWSPAEIPYDDILNSAIPWVAVLFAGFFPSLSEEFISRAFSIPLFERLFRSRVAAFIIAGFIWGFGHATYPNQPFFIRGVEVGMAGVMLGFILFRFGLLPLLIWHYTVDALYTALLLFRSHNTYYIVSAGAAALIFAGPMLISLGLYFRSRGFAPDEDLSNAAVGSAPPLPVKLQEEVALLPPASPAPHWVFAALAAAVIAAIALAAMRPPAPDDAIDYRIPKTTAAAIAVRHVKQIGISALPERRVVGTRDGFRTWDRSARQEEGGGPDGFDSTAADYMLRHGLPMRALIDVFERQIPTGTWMARFFTPGQKHELFVEVDPRSQRVIGFHEYQEEKNPGASLDQPAAERVALAAFPRYGVDPRGLQLKEALSFPQAARRDWLFHFDQKQPIVGEAFRRISVRVAGDRVTQFATTVRIPESEYRAAQQHSLFNTILTVLRIAALVAIASLAIAGLVMTTRRGLVRRRALRWTPVLMLIPIASALASLDSLAANYDTTIAWQTYLISATIAMVTRIAFQGLLIFLSIAAIDTAYPFAVELFRRSGLRRFGRDAARRALAALAIPVCASLLNRWVSAHWTSASMISSPAIPAAVSIALPAVVLFLQAIVRTLFACAVLAMLSVSIRGSEKIFRWWPALTFVVLVATFIEPDATMRQLPLTLTTSCIMALAIVLALRVLGTNLLAWPVAIFVTLVAEDAVDMLGNQRRDLIVGGTALLIAIVMILIVVAREREIVAAATTPSS
jgi:membrane protease YdiL (CAAX protease family)